jgi:chemotaxis protein MotB
MARRKKHAEHVNHERWLVSYADFITLLFAFFVVMFAASNSDEKKVGQIAQAVQVAFKDLGMFTPAGKVVPLHDDGGLANAPARVFGSTKSPFSQTTQLNESSPDLTRVRMQLEEMLRSELRNQTVHIRQDSRGVVVSLAEAGFFDSGSAVVNAGGLAVLERIAEKLHDIPQDLRIEGHTDNTPIHTVPCPSNWELSTARATHVLGYLIMNARIPPERLSAVGYGEYRPAASNATPEGKAANRRVDVVILSSEAQTLEPEKAATSPP